VVAHNLLSKHKAPTYRTLVENMLATFRIMGCNMSLTLRFLHSHGEFFEANFEVFLTSMVSDVTTISPLQKNANKASNAGQLMPGNRKENSSYILEKRKYTTIQRNCMFGRKFLFILT